MKSILKINNVPIESIFIFCAIFQITHSIWISLILTIFIKEIIQFILSILTQEIVKIIRKKIRNTIF